MGEFQILKFRVFQMQEVRAMSKLESNMEIQNTQTRYSPYLCSQGDVLWEFMALVNCWRREARQWLLVRMFADFAVNQFSYSNVCLYHYGFES